jgi:hypothetical protein
MADNKENPEAVDWLLRVLVSTANRVERQGGQLNVPVTLNVSGFLVSGYLIGGSTYFDNFSSQFKTGLENLLSEEGAAEVATNLTEAPKNLYEEEGSDDRDITRHFVHLRDAKFIHPSGDSIPSDSGVLWRGRLEAIDGFFLGVLQSTSEE